MPTKFEETTNEKQAYYYNDDFHYFFGIAGIHVNAQNDALRS